MTEDGTDLIEKIERLLARSRSSRFDDPSRMVYLAELALAAADQLDDVVCGRNQTADLRARVLAELANSYRLADALESAEWAIDRALDWFERGSQAPALLLLISDRLASILGHRRRFSEACELLDRLVSLYEAQGDAHLAARALIKRAAYTSFSGDPQAAILLTCDALTLIDAQAEPALLLIGLHNLVTYLTDLGEHHLAAEYLERIRPLYGSDRLHLLRLKWVEARIADAAGRMQDAERLYHEARTGFHALQLVFPTSLVSLELALLLTKDRRWPEVRALAEELLLAFQKLKAGRESVVALVLLRRATERQEVAEAEVRDRVSQAIAIIRSLGQGQI